MPIGPVLKDGFFSALGSEFLGAPPLQKNHPDSSWSPDHHPPTQNILNPKNTSEESVLGVGICTQGL